MKIFALMSEKVSFIKKFLSQLNFKELYEETLNTLKYNFKDITIKIKNIAQTNFDLGIYHYLLGNRSDAILRFNIAKLINPKYLASDFYIGRCYFENFKYKKAKFYLKKYLESKHEEFVEETKYCLKVLNNEVSEVSYIPKNIIKMTFDIAAQAYLKSKLSFQPQNVHHQQALFSTTAQLLMAKNKPFGNDILDMGCGLGTIGKLCRSQRIANIMIGIDISPLMAKYSSYLSLDDMKIYNNINVTDYEKYMESPTSNFDVIFASDFITYNTDLDQFFKSTYNIAKEGGLLSITFKTSNDKDVEFKPLIEQFYFSLNYIEAFAYKYGWKQLKEEKVNFPNNQHGQLVIFNK